MSDLLKDVNEAIGTLRAFQEYLSQPTKLIVDTSVAGFPSVLEATKSNIINSLNRVERVMLRIVNTSEESIKS